MATIGWIDLSPKQRSLVAGLLDALSSEGVVDELGIRPIRDALAELMFPGLSTIQTRAKYFFIIPYILCDYQNTIRRGKKRTAAHQYLEDEENELMWQLAERYEHDADDQKGVIGITKQRGQKLARRPSEIYWNGLRAFNIIAHNGLSCNAYLRLQTQLYFKQLGQAYAGDDSAQDDAEVEYENIFRIRIEYDPDWRENIKEYGLELTSQEADTLAQRFRDTGADRVLGELVDNRTFRDEFLQQNNFSAAAKAGFTSCSPKVQYALRLAHDFSEMMYGAHILYNHLLQKAKYGSDRYLDDFMLWHSELRTALISYADFDAREILQQAPQTHPARQEFVLRWSEAVRKKTPDLLYLGRLVKEQERNAKRHKARLVMNRLDDVEKDRWIGLKRLEYRLRQARQMIEDIKYPCEAGNA